MTESLRQFRRSLLHSRTWILFGLILTGLWPWVRPVDAAPVRQISTVRINEIRIDQPGTDIDEYFELVGPSGQSLTGLTYVVIGDSTAAGSGVIEAVVDLAGQVIPASGFFVAAENTFTLSVADLIVNLDFENADNVTHVLVEGFTGSNGQDLDTNDDGILDVTPWASIVDLVALIEADNPPPFGVDYHYGPPTVGPRAGGEVPTHVYRCPDVTGVWSIGQNDPVGGSDTPGAANYCPVDLPPQVMTTSPANGATGVPTTTTITLNFSEAVDLTANAVTLNCGGAIGLGGLPAANVTSVVLTPAVALPGSTLCTVTVIAAQVTDRDGAADFLDGNRDGTPGDNYVFSFQTGIPVATYTIINETDTDQDGTDVAEFIELYDGGAGNTALDGLVIVLYNGADDESYAAFDLDGYSTSATGYFVVCGDAGIVPNCNLDITPDATWLQNGPDAVALYAADASSFPNNTPLTTVNLLDAIVYDTSDADDPALWVLLNPGQPQVDEGGGGNSDIHSNQRCPNGSGGQRNTITYAQYLPTPGAENVCVFPPQADLELSKDVNNNNPFEGDTIVFTIEVTNDGPDEATGVVVRDYLPDTTTQVENVTNDCGATLAGNTLTWTVGNIPALATVTCHITADVRTGTDGTSFENAAEVWASDAFDDDSLPGNYAGVPAEDDEDRVTLQVGILPECADPYTAIPTLQENGANFGDPGPFTVQGVVTGEFQPPSPNGLSGYYVQDMTGDGDPLTSDGIFVRDPTPFFLDVVPGQIVRLTGTVSEALGQTQITPTVVRNCGRSGGIAPITVTLPIADLADWEQYEGMLVELRAAGGGPLTVTDTYYLGRYGEISVSSGGRLYAPTQYVAPGPAALAEAELGTRRRLIIDDGRNGTPPDGTVPYIPATVSAFRQGYQAVQLTGVLAFRNTDYRLHPTVVPNWTPGNPRRPVPNVGGTLTVASFDVMNFFNGDGQGGGFPTSEADTETEFDRQRAKLAAAVCGMDADIVGLIEIENDDGAYSAIVDLVTAVNDACGPYDFIDTGIIGGRSLRVALIYRGTVTPVGSYAWLQSSVDPLFNDAKNHPTLAQSFQEVSTQEIFTVVVNYFKSKLPTCSDVGDPDIGDGQGECSITRTNAATAVINWIASDPTGVGDPDFLVIGNLNSYAQEDPIAVFVANGYENLLERFDGADTYSYTEGGVSGYLDYGWSNPSLTPFVTGAAVWHINADEPKARDYNDDVLTPGEGSGEYNQPYLYQPDGYRSSNHDPILVGLNLAGIPPMEEPTPAPGADDDGTGTVIFDPALSKIGMLLPGSVGLAGERLAWVITVTNTGTGTGTDIVITDTLPDELRIDSVETDRGSFSINGQTVTFFIPWLDPGESVQMRINTTVLRSPAGDILTNEASLTGIGPDGSAISRRATAVVPLVTELPATGYPPHRTSTHFDWLSLLAAAGLLVLVSGFVVWRCRHIAS